MTTAPTNFRHLARQALSRARAELAANDQHRLRYAALELRETMEALTYDRALAFKEYIPPEEYKTWQSRKLMMVLLDIDPLIGMTSDVAFGPQNEDGKSRPENMKLLGTDRVFTLADLKDHYDAISSYLHMPSLKQLQLGKLPDETKLRAQCDEIIFKAERVLSSPIWNVDLNFVATIECMNEDCKKPVRKRIPVGKDSVEVQCFECKAEYIITSEDDNRVRWTPKKVDAECSTPGCPETVALWNHELKQGTNWRCRGCGKRNVIALALTQGTD